MVNIELKYQNHYVQMVFNSVCGGGVWFDNTLTGKQTIENAQVFQLALKLARLQQELEECTGRSIFYNLS